MFKKLILLAFVLTVIAAFSSAASAAIITGVVRANGASGTQDPIGVFDGSTQVLATQAGGLMNGNLVRTDRTHTWSNTPAQLVGVEYVRTFNSDKGASGVTYAVTFSRLVTIGLAVDDRFSLQSTADGIVSRFASAGTFTDTGLNVYIYESSSNPNRPMSVFSAIFPAGTYTFGGQANSNNFYTIIALPGPNKAFDPIPADGSRTPPSGEIGDGYWMTLTFTAGYGATTHTAYFSDNFDSVNDRNIDVRLGSPPYPEMFANTYYVGYDDAAIPEFARTPLERGITYYWAVDESNSTSTYPGDVWSFVIAPESAWNPTPADGAIYINNASVALTWEMGDVDNVTYLVSYDVYWGADEAAVAADTTPDAHVTSATHTIGPLPNDTDYYWKVNTQLMPKNPPFIPTIIPGDVWQFKTKPYIAIGDATRIGWWTFDEEEGAGNTVVDWSGYGNDGTIRGGAQRVPGRNEDAENAIDLSGAGQSVAITLTGGVPTINPPEVSVAMWAKPDTTSGQQMMWFTHETSGYGKLRCRINGGNWLFTSGQGATANNIDATGPAVVAGEWVHYVGMKIDNDALYVYIDGALGGRADFLVGGNLSTNSWIGAEEGTANYFNGLIDDVQLYLRALSAQEIKVMAGRLTATNPDPANGATDVSRTPTLSWSPGAYAAATNGNKVYYSQDADAVTNRTVTGVTVTDPCYPITSTLDLGTTYYWAVDTVNGLDVWQGDLWRFTTIDWLSVDDMEAYVPYTNSTGPWVFVKWRDAFGDCTPGNGNNTGSTVAENADPVNGGIQSMKCDYDNDGTVLNICTIPPTQEGGHLRYSKIEAQIAALPSGIGTNWAAQGVKALSLRFYGGALNDVEPMWVQLKDGTKGYGNKVTYGDYEDEDPNAVTEEPNAVTQEPWHEWFIDMADFDVDLTNLVSISIGFGNEDGSGSHGSGTVYFDDIRLYTPRCMPSRHTEEMAKLDFAPVGAPDCVVNYKELDVMAEDWLLTDTLETGELLVRWQFNETAGTTASDTSGKGHHGDVNDVNGVSWVNDAERGRCLDFAGGDYVLDNDANTYLNGLHGLTIAVWVKNREVAATDQGFIIFEDPAGNDDRDMRYDAAGGNGGGTPSVIKCGVTTTSSVGEPIQQIESSEGSQVTGVWQHLALTWSTGEELKLYINGVLDPPSANRAGTVGVTTGATKLIVGKGGKDNAVDLGWNGLIDDVQIYNYALSAAEVATVMDAGTIAPKPVHYPVPSSAEIYQSEAQGNQVVNFKDYAELMDSWLLEIKYPQ